jgi:formate hydrogenlyase subunit 3/multisubunit Na+/H+ antiporter MnhD subunit
MDFGDMVDWLLCVVGLSFFIIPALPVRIKTYGALVLVASLSFISSYFAVKALNSGGIEFILNGGVIFGEIPLRIDALSAWFILIINITALTGGWYGVGYTRNSQVTSSQLSLHWIAYVIFHLSMLAVCMVQHSMAFLIVWEIMTISSLILILFEYSSPKTVHSALNYLVQMHIGVVLITIGFIINFQITGSFDFNAFSSGFQQTNGKWVFSILFLGFGIKSGFIPLHTWLPHAHPAAPSHVSGVMSGVIVKMGIYGILRMIVNLKTDMLVIGEMILILSILTAFYGIFNAAVHRDFKKMLAYCTVENIGIIGMGIGIGLIGKGAGNDTIAFIGFSGAVLHTLNHSLYKSLLFFSAGNVYLSTHTRNMDHLGGLIKRMPKTAFFFLCGALAICGFPPFNGFVSEFLIYTGLIEGIQLENTQFSSLMIISIAFLAFVGGVSVLAFSKTFSIIFLGSPRREITHQTTEVSSFMLFPLAFILLLMLAIGIFPGMLLVPLTQVVMVFDVNHLDANRFHELFALLSQIGIASLTLIVLCGGIFFIRTYSQQKRSATISSTWGCGYTAANSHMQYSSKSYSRSLIKLFSFITLEKKKYKEISALSIFPKYRSFQSYLLDFFEERIFRPLINYLLSFTTYFTFIHNGKVQLYILYGVFFIMILIAITFINIF